MASDPEDGSPNEEPPAPAESVGPKQSEAKPEPRAAEPELLPKTAAAQAAPPIAAKRAVPLAISFVVAGWLYGTLEGLSLQIPEQRGLVLLLCAVLASIFAVALGIVLSLAQLGARRVPFFARLTERRSAPSAVDAATRERRIELYGNASAALIAVVVASLVAMLVLKVLFGLQELELARQLAVVMVAGLLIASVVAVPLLARVLKRVIARLAKDREVALPAWAFMLLFVTLPLFLGLYPVMARYAVLLGPIRELLTVLMLVALAAQLALVARTIPSRAARPVAAVLGLVALVGIAFVARLPAKQARLLVGAEKTSAASLGARMARFVTDFDRDGASSLFGGRDCAPFDKNRGPSKAEIPGNGIDEDCNGSDTVAAWGEHGTYQMFSDALSPKQVKPYNILWIVIETIRADHVSALGYEKPTTPYVAKLAKESLLFARAYSNSSATHLSIPSMLSGVDPGVAVWDRSKTFPQLPDNPLSLAERLKAKGYRTGLVVDNYTAGNFTRMQRGFDQKLRCEPDNKNQNNRPRRNLISTANTAEFLSSSDNDPFFFVTYFADTHAPYTRHKDVDSSKFSKDDLGNYDTEIAWTDQQIQAVVELLKARPAVWNNTILVITADHGEEFEEHGQTQHAKTCYDEVLHVPLLVRIPGVAAQRIESRVALIDIVPTLLELTGTRDDTEGLTGQSLLLPALKPELVDANRPIFCTVSSITPKHGVFFKRSVRTDSYALLEDVHAGVFSLFDTKNDPGELNDLANDPARKADLDRLRGLIEANLTGNMDDHTHR